MSQPIDQRLLELLQPVLISLGSPDLLAKCPYDISLKLATHPDDISAVTSYSFVLELTGLSGAYQVYNKYYQLAYQVSPGDQCFGRSQQDLLFMNDLSDYDYFYITYNQDRVIMVLYVRSI